MTGLPGCGGDLVNASPALPLIISVRRKSPVVVESGIVDACRPPDLDREKDRVGTREAGEAVGPMPHGLPPGCQPMLLHEWDAIQSE
jgi:hypothetical protein